MSENEMKQLILDYIFRSKRFINANRNDVLDEMNNGKYSYWEGYQDALKAFENKINSL